ncbi:MAG: hypothetical protein FWC06_05385 [Treponema sp.]|nr:hypothetical protein [Treponema sp.]
MQPVNIFETLKQVITSWQVIAITLLMLLYIHIVSNASKSYRRPRTSKKVKAPNKKQVTPESTDSGPEEVVSSENSNEELGLEEMQ